MQKENEIEDIIEDITPEELQQLEEAKKKIKEEEDAAAAEKDDGKKEDDDLEEAKEVTKEEDEECDDDKEDDLEEAKKVDGKVDGKDDDEKEDDGKGLDKVGDEDGDVDNDGDSDKSDDFLTKRRQAIEKDKEKKESVDFVADLNTLAESDDSLSEEFKEKAGIIFEVALTTRVRDEVEKIQEEYNNQLSEEVVKIRESLEEKIDNYLTYAVESWVEDNKIAIEGGLRTEVAESFIYALKNVFVEHYIEVPETKKDIVSELETKLTFAEEALSVSSAKTEELSEQVNSLVREKILAEAAESLADTQQDRLKALAEGIEFVDAETFTKKVNTIKECYFKGKAEVIEEEPTGSYKVTEVIVEEETSDLSPTMQNYVKALGRINKATTLVK